MVYDFKDSITGDLLKSVEVKLDETKNIELNIVGVESINVYDQEFFSPKCRVVFGEPKFK